MHRFVSLQLALLPFALHAELGETYYTHPVGDDVKTLRVVADGDFAKLPVIDNTQNSGLEISFDILSDEQVYVQYYLVHCDADWQQDDLSELDYVDGFMPVRMEGVQPSFNTLVNYWHYSLSFPNQELPLLISGNYAVVFHVEDEPEDVLAVACFSVTERLAFLGGEVTAKTDIDYMAQHQQLTLQCSWSQARMPYLDAGNDLHLVVTQNRRPDTRRDVLHPTRIEGGKVWYEHQQDLIFEAGNTFRRFEFIDRHYATFGVERLRYAAPYYEVELVEQRSRQGGVYLFDHDQHGRFVTHAVGVDDVNTEGEYFWANFTLAGAMPPRKGRDIYLTGDFTYGQLLPQFRMEYDTERGCFTGRVRLKQGHYNYQFVVGEEWIPGDTDEGYAPASLAPVEGNYYETQNEYDLYMYYRAPGDRYDRLLGVGQLTFR